MEEKRDIHEKLRRLERVAREQKINRICSFTNADIVQELRDFADALERKFSQHNNSEQHSEQVTGEVKADE